MNLTTAPFLFLSIIIIAASDAAKKSSALKTRGGAGRQLKGGKGGGKGGGGRSDIFELAVTDYKEPPAGVLPGDIITACNIKLTDDLDCSGAFTCLTLDATDGNVELDCDGHTIGSYDNDNVGIDLMGCNNNTITIKNCHVTGFEDCIDAGSNDNGCYDYNVVIENTAVVGCERDGMDFTSYEGSLSLTQVVATGNGDDGISIGNGKDRMPENVVLDQVFACGNGKNDKPGNFDIDFSLDRRGPRPSLITTDVTLNNLDGESFETIPCPLYQDATCVSVNSE